MTMNRMLRTVLMVTLSMALALGVWMRVPDVAAIDIDSGFDTTEAFSIGVAATATVPTDWRVDKNTGSRTVGTWSAAVTATEQRAGNNMSPTAANGIYNFGAGDPATATDRAIGWVSSASATKSGNLYASFTNVSVNNLGSIDISYDVEKYRQGSNPAGFCIQLYYSTDGDTWTSAGSDFYTCFTADADNTGYANAPGETVSINSKRLTFATEIAPDGDFYLAWNYSVATGTTTSNAQALGVDNVRIHNPLQPNAVALSGLNATSPFAALAVGLLAAAGLVVLRKRK